MGLEMVRAGQSGVLTGTAQYCMDLTRMRLGCKKLAYFGMVIRGVLTAQFPRAAVPSFAKLTHE
jgi:hypothetical protein